MTDRTALNRLGDVILWLGTAVLVLCIAAGAVSAYFYIVGTKAFVDQKAVFEVTAPNGEKFLVTAPTGKFGQDAVVYLKRVVALLEDERRGLLSAERLEALNEVRRRGLVPESFAASGQSDALFAKGANLKVVKMQEAKRVPTTHHDEDQLYFALGFAAVGLISWFVLASVAYIFNGRSPVAVFKGLFSPT
jgi:hypothetical protein